MTLEERDGLDLRSGGAVSGSVARWFAAERARRFLMVRPIGVAPRGEHPGVRTHGA